MDGIEKIIGRISDDTREEIDGVLAEANAQAAELTAAYEAQAAEAAEGILARGKKAAGEREERLAAVAQLECRKNELAAKQEVIEEAFALALKKLQELPEAEAVALLADLAVQASTTGKEQLIFSAEDRELGKKVVSAANEKLARKVAPELPGELTGSKVGAVLDKVVTGASALLAGTGMLTLSEQTRPTKGGFILSNGDVEVNCTFDTLIRLQKGTLAGQVAKVLFD